MAWNHLICLVSEPTTYLYLGLLILYFYYSSEPVRQVQRDNNMQINALGYTVGVFSKQGFPIVVGLGAVAFFSDLPLFRSNIMYESIRCKREEWIASRVIYILEFSILYTVALIGICIVATDGTIQTDWGKILNALAHGYSFNGMSLNATMNFSYMSIYTPVEALLLVGGMCSLATFSIGVMMLCLSISVGRIPAIIAGGILPLIDVMVENGLPYWAYRFSPFSFIRLSIMMSDGKGYFPSIGQAVLGLSMVIIVFVGMSILLVKRNNMFIRQLFNEQY